MKITLYFALSCNGFIAHSDGTEEFISDAAWKLSEKLAAQNDAIIVGRTTFENVENWNDPQYSLDALQVKERVLVSSDENYQPKTGWVHAVSPEDAVSTLEARGCMSAYLVGGAQLAGSFLNKGLVDHASFYLQPWLVSEGIPMVKGLLQDREMKLLSADVMESGEVLMEYQIIYA